MARTCGLRFGKNIMPEIKLSLQVIGGEVVLKSNLGMYAPFCDEYVDFMSLEDFFEATGVEGQQLLSGESVEADNNWEGQ
jgi:hypothetical protein